MMVSEVDMMTNREKQRIPLTLSKELVKRLDEEAKMAGTTRGAMLASWIADKVRQLDVQREMVKRLTSEENLNNLIKYAMEAKFNGKDDGIDYEQLALNLGQKGDER